MYGRDRYESVEYIDRTDGLLPDGTGVFGVLYSGRGVIGTLSAGLCE